MWCWCIQIDISLSSDGPITRRTHSQHVHKWNTSHMIGVWNILDTCVMLLSHWHFSLVRWSHRQVNTLTTCSQTEHLLHDRGMKYPWHICDPTFRLTLLSLIRGPTARWTHSHVHKHTRWRHLQHVHKQNISDMKGGWNIIGKYVIMHSNPLCDVKIEYSLQRCDDAYRLAQ